MDFSAIWDSISGYLTDGSFLSTILQYIIDALMSLFA